MESINKNNRAVMRLLANAKGLLGVAYSDEEFKQVFSIIRSAKMRGYLGIHKSPDICLDECVNIANKILRNPDTEGVGLDEVINQPKSLYVYVALVAIGLISA